MALLYSFLAKQSCMTHKQAHMPVHLYLNICHQVQFKEIAHDWGPNNELYTMDLKTTMPSRNRDTQETAYTDKNTLQHSYHWPSIFAYFSTEASWFVFKLNIYLFRYMDLRVCRRLCRMPDCEGKAWVCLSCLTVYPLSHCCCRSDLSLHKSVTSTEALTKKTNVTKAADKPKKKKVGVRWHVIYLKAFHMESPSHGETLFLQPLSYGTLYLSLKIVCGGSLDLQQLNKVW